MPVTWYRSHQQAERDLPPSLDPETGLRTAIVLGRLDEATRRGVRISPRGVQRFASVSEAERERERFAIARLREADRAGGSAPSSGAQCLADEISPQEGIERSRTRTQPR